MNEEFNFNLVTHDPKTVLDNIDHIIGVLFNSRNRYTRIGVKNDINNFYYFNNGDSTALKDLIFIKRIKTKNQALLNMRHKDSLVRYHCKRILKR